MHGIPCQRCEGGGGGRNKKYVKRKKTRKINEGGGGGMNNIKNTFSIFPPNFPDCVVRREIIEWFGYLIVTYIITGTTLIPSSSAGGSFITVT